MHVAGGVEAFLEDHAVIVMSDHSQTPVEERVNLADAVRRRARAGARRPGADGGRAGASAPAARSAMVYALDEARRAELVAGAVATLEASDGVDLVATRDDGEAVVRSGRGELRFAPGGDLSDRRGAGLERGGRHGRAGPRRARRPRDQRDLPRRARPALVGARVPALRRRAGVRGARLRVRRLGRGRPRGRRQPRLPASRRLGGRAAALRASTHPSARSGRSTDVAPLVLDHFGVPLPWRGATRARLTRARARRRSAQAAQLGAAR